MIKTLKKTVNQNGQQKEIKTNAYPVRKKHLKPLELFVLQTLQGSRGQPFKQPACFLCSSFSKIGAAIARAISIIIPKFGMLRQLNYKVDIRM